MIRGAIAVLVSCVVVATGCATVQPRAIADLSPTFVPLPPVPCVDAVGENSTLEAMGDAKALTPYLRERGEVYSESKYETFWATGEPFDPLDPASVAAIAASGSRTALLYADTPAGGDAAFAESVCEREFDWKAGLSAEQFETVMSTPGFLRSLGRTICSDIDRSENRAEYFELLDDDLEDAERSSKGQVEWLIEMHRNSLAERIDYLTAPIDPTDLPDNRRSAENDVINLTDIIAMLGSETDEHLLQIARDKVAVAHAALDNQCPALKVR